MIATVATVALTVAGALALAPAASAAAPEPATPNFGRAIDPLASYDPQRTCSPTAKPGTTAFANLIKQTYGSSQTIYIGRSCSSGGTSEHKEGRALDWMRSERVPSQKEQADAFIRWLMRTDQYGNTYAMARRLGVMYIIWKSRMWRAYDPGRGWSGYSNCLSDTRSSQDTRCHRDHPHISLSWPGARAQTSWYTGAGQPSACSTTGTALPPSLPSNPTGFVPLSQARVIDTATGTGTASGECRLEAGQTSVFQVTGRGGVPASGVSAVAVKARVHKPSQDTRLTVFPAGAARPDGYTAAAASGASRMATTVVPVSQDGKIAVSLSGGSTAFSLDVLGYYPQTGGVPFRTARQERILTRTLAPRETVTVDVGGHAGIPASGVHGVVLGAHVWNPSVAGGLGAWTGAPSINPPAVNALHFPAGPSRSGRVVVPATDDGRIKMQNRSDGTIRMSLDAVGWFGQGQVSPRFPAGGAQYEATASRLVMNTATDLGVSGAFTKGRAAGLQLGGSAVPSDAYAVVLQVGAVRPTAHTRISAWRSGVPQPGTGQLYPRAGETTAEVVVVPLGTDGRVNFANRSGTVDLRVNLLGYYR